jgi:hypothetical protein
MDPQRQSVAEAGAHLLVRDALAELRAAAHTLTTIEQSASDSEGARRLVALRAAIDQLETFVRPMSKG